MSLSSPRPSQIISGTTPAAEEEAAKLFSTIAPELEAEKAKRLQAAVEAGEAVVLQPWVVTGERGKMPTQGEIEAAKAEELERFRRENPSDARVVHFDVQFIVTGVESRPIISGSYQSDEETTSPERRATRQSTEKRYVRAQIEPGDGDDPGQIAEGLFWIEFDQDPAGRVVVQSLTGEFVGGKSLQGSQDAATLARQILKGAHERYKRLAYPNLGIV